MLQCYTLVIVLFVLSKSRVFCIASFQVKRDKRKYFIFVFITPKVQNGKSS